MKRSITPYDRLHPSDKHEVNRVLASFCIWKDESKKRARIVLGTLPTIRCAFRYPRLRTTLRSRARLSAIVSSKIEWEGEGLANEE